MTPTSRALITENIPQSIRALRAAPAFSQIDCLLNAPRRSFTSLHRATRGAKSKIAFPRMEQKRCCTKNTASRSRGSARLRISRRDDLRECARQTTFAPVTATTDFLAPDILAGRRGAVPAPSVFLRSTLRPTRCGEGRHPSTVPANAAAVR